MYLKKMTSRLAANKYLLAVIREVALMMSLEWLMRQLQMRLLQQQEWDIPLVFTTSRLLNV
jgi:hypothetical protein